MIDKVDDNGTIYNYSYDKLGNITEVKKDNTLTNKYYYDMYSQLIKEDDLVNNLTKTYTYDNYGNILSKKTYTYNTTNLIKEDTYQYNNSSWQDLLTKFNNESITYDEIGNPLTIGNKTLTWMNGRELSTYSDGTNNISYKYNLNGIRTSKIVNGIKTNYILEGTSIIFEDRNGTMIYYIYNGDELLGFVYNSKTYYYHKNMFGDIIGILDSNYNGIVKYSYDSWGALVNITDNSNINLGTINPFRYRSYYYDTETQLYYLNSRYYNPQIGRFINADSTPSTGQDFNGMNMFCYCGNNPIVRIDAGGSFWLVTLALSVTVGTVCGIISFEAQRQANIALGVENIYAGCGGAFIAGLTGGVLAVTFPQLTVTAIVISSFLGQISNMYYDKQSFSDTISNTFYDVTIGTVVSKIGVGTLAPEFNSYSAPQWSTYVNSAVSNVQDYVNQVIPRKSNTYDQPTNTKLSLTIKKTYVQKPRMVPTSFYEFEDNIRKRNEARRALELVLVNYNKGYCLV